MAGSVLTITLSPIALFAYRRAEHTARALRSLEQNPEFTSSPLFIYCDSARKPTHAADVEYTRQVVRSWPHPNKTVIERREHMGLANSVITGVTELIACYGKLIVVEDDLVTSRAFLKYLNHGLDHFADDSRVMQISAYMFPVTISSGTDAVMLPLTTSWGWATWGRAWQDFDPSMSGIEALEKDRELRHKFDVNGSYPYFRMLRQQARGAVDSWAIRWYKSVFFRGGLTLYPRKSLVRNTGFGRSATHTSWRRGSESTELWQQAPVVYPRAEIDQDAMREVCRHLRSQTSVLRALTPRLASLWPIRSAKHEG